jgi:hypothetical protein
MEGDICLGDRKTPLLEREVGFCALRSGKEFPPVTIRDDQNPNL